MSLPRYHDDPVPSRPWNRYQDRLLRSPDGSLRIWRLWASLYDAIRRDPLLPVTALQDIAQQAFFYEDDEMGYIPRITVPIAAVIGIVRQAIRTNPKRTRPAVPAKFKQIVQDAFVAPEKITGEKLDLEGESQFSENMVDQRGSLRTILQGGITPFTNMRAQNLVLGRSLKYRPRNPLNQLTSKGGTVSVPFAYRFHTDLSNERKSAVLVFRHNKAGIPIQTTFYKVPNSTTTSWTNNTGASTSLTYIKEVDAAASEAAGNDPWDAALSSTAAIANGATYTFTAGDYIPPGSPAYPVNIRTHKWGYDDAVKVFPAQYNNDPPAYPKVGDKTLKGPFEEIENDSDGKPQFYLAALNRSDLEDMSLQLQPQVLRRQGNVIDLLKNTSANWNTHPDASATSDYTGGVKSQHSGESSAFVNIHTGWVPFSNEHSHNQMSTLAKLNVTDDNFDTGNWNALPRGHPQDTKWLTGAKRALGISFKYDAIIKTGGVKYTCVNRGGSGCNVDIHVFKLKLKHIHEKGSSLGWDDLVKPYEDAYIKRAHEIITNDDLKGRPAVKTDIWDKAKFPLLPGSRHVNREDEYLTRIEKSSCFIPSQGRKNINVVFPGERYDPAEEMFGSDNSHTDYDRFTYFALVSVTGEKSNAMFSSTGQLGTLIETISHTASQEFTDYQQDDEYHYPNASVPTSPALSPTPSRFFHGSTPTSNVVYNQWLSVHQTWEYTYDVWMFYTDKYINDSVNGHGAHWLMNNVAHWEVNQTQGPFPGNSNVYTGHKFTSTRRLPLPSLSEWLANNYDHAVADHGLAWKPPLPAVTLARYWANAKNRYTFDASGAQIQLTTMVFGYMFTFPLPLPSIPNIFTSTSAPYTAKTWTVLDSISWPTYNTTTHSVPSPASYSHDVERNSVRDTNLFFSSPS